MLSPSAGLHRFFLLFRQHCVKADFRAVWLGSRISCFPNFSSLVCKGIYIYICCIQLLSSFQLFATLWTAACQASLSLTISWSLLKLMSIESVMPANHLILCHPFLLLPSIFPSIRVFSNELILRIRWPKYCSFRFSISPRMNI